MRTILDQESLRWGDLLGIALRNEFNNCCKTAGRFPPMVVRKSSAWDWRTLRRRVITLCWTAIANASIIFPYAGADLSTIDDTQDGPMAGRAKLAEVIGKVGDISWLARLR